MIDGHGTRAHRHEMRTPPRRTRLAILLGLLALSLIALANRSSVQRLLYGQASAKTAAGPAPELPALKTLNVSHPPLRMRDLRGQVVLLHFWTFG